MLFIIKTPYENLIDAQLASFRSLESACRFAAEIQVSYSRAIIELSVCYSSGEEQTTRRLFMPEVPINGRDRLRLYLNGIFIFSAYSFRGCYDGFEDHNVDLSHMYAVNLSVGQANVRMTDLYFTSDKDTALADPFVYREPDFHFFKPSKTENNYVVTNWQQEGF